MAESPRPAHTALVTGASRGIGRSIALGLAEAGVGLALVATNESLLEQVASEVAVLGRGVSAHVADVSDPRAVRAAVALAEDTHGGIDLLVNAAGVLGQETVLWECDPDDWWRVMEVNVRGPFLLARALVPAMIERGGGRIIDLSSGAATHDMGTCSAYNASKTALARMGAHLHDAGYEQGIRAFELAPGVVKTDMTLDADMHVGRTEWTPVERTIELVNSIARGDLDPCSGWLIRAGADTPSSLLELAAAEGAKPPARRLRLQPAGPSDPLSRRRLAG